MGIVNLKLRVAMGIQLISTTLAALPEGTTLVRTTSNELYITFYLKHRLLRGGAELIATYIREMAWDSVRNDYVEVDYFAGLNLKECLNDRIETFVDNTVEADNDITVK